MIYSGSCEMTEKPPRIKERGKSIPRDHSPYCEGTGPIVHEGFVAARIRDFQALQHDRAQVESHSPMIPFSEPPWPQICDHQSTPKPMFTPKPYTFVIKRRSVPSMKLKLDGPQADLDTESCQDSVWGHKHRHTIRLYEKDICCPRAIPPSLALPLGDPQKYHKGINDIGNASDRYQLTRPRCSIAEKLGLMVDSNLEGYGSLNSDMRPLQILRTYSTPEQINESNRDIEILSDGYIPNLPLTSRSGDGLEPQLERPQDSPGEAQCFEGGARQYLGDIQLEAEQLPYERIATPGPGHMAVYEDSTAPITGIGPEAFLAGESSTKHHIMSRGGSNNSTAHPNKRLRTRSASLSQLIDRHLTDWTALEKFQSRQPTTSTSIRANALESEPQQNAPETQNADTNQSGTMKQRSRQSSMRSASWFSMFPRLRIALVDKAPSAKKSLSRKASCGSIGSIQAQEGNFRPGALDNEPGEERPGSHRQDGAEQCLVTGLITGPVNQTASANANHQCVEPRSDGVAEILGAGDMLPSDEKIPCSGLASVSDKASLSSIQSNANASLPRQAQDSDSLKGSSGHKSEDAKENAKEQSTKEELYGISRTAGVANVAYLANDKQEPVLKESDASRNSGWRPLSPLRASTDARSIRSQFHVPMTEEGATDSSSRGVQWEAAGQERGIRRVQVIVSLDGSEDLLIEARLFRQAKSDGGVERLPAYSFGNGG